MPGEISAKEEWLAFHKTLQSKSYEVRFVHARRFFC